MDGGGGEVDRGSQSVQSVPLMQSLSVLPGPPSSQTSSSAYGHVFVHVPSIGGADGDMRGGAGDGGKLGGVVMEGAKISPALTKTLGVALFSSRMTF